VGLGGEVRAVAHADKRIQELKRLGFARAILARTALEGLPSAPIAVRGVSHVAEVATLLAAGGGAGGNAV
jgi:predicted ATP-dependent serine protease